MSRTSRAVLARVSVFERKFAIFATKAAPLGGRRFTPFAVFLRRQHAGQSTVVFEICSECFHHLRYFYEGSTDQCTGVFEICRFSFHEEYRQHCIQTDSTIQTALSLECRAPPRSRDGRRRKNALALDVDSMNASILFVNFLTWMFFRVLVSSLCRFFFSRSRPNPENPHKKSRNGNSNFKTKIASERFWNACSSRQCD